MHRHKIFFYVEPKVARNIIAFTRSSFVCDFDGLVFVGLDTTGQGDWKPFGNCNRHEHGEYLHPQSASSTLKTTLNTHGCSFKGYKNVTCTIVSLRDMWKIEPHGRVTATCVVNTCGVIMVHCYSCGHIAISNGILNYGIFYLAVCVLCLHAVRPFEYVGFYTCPIVVFNCVQHLWISRHHHFWMFL